MQLLLEDVLAYANKVFSFPTLYKRLCTVEFWPKIAHQSFFGEQLDGWCEESSSSDSQEAAEKQER